MPTCRSCDAALSREWNYCIHCGVPAPVSAFPARLASPVAPVPSTVVPPAIRPPAPETRSRRRTEGRRRADLALVFGIALSVTGLALVVLFGVLIAGVLL